MPKRNKQKRASKRQVLPSPWDDLKAVGRTAGRALTIFKGAASLLNAEAKHVDFQNSATITTTPVLYFFSGIAQGDSVSARDGNSVKLKGGLLKLCLTISTAATATTVRLLVVCDTRNPGSAPTASTIYDTSVVRANGNINVDSEPNRFVVLYDHLVSLDTASRRQFILDLALEALRDMHLTFSGTDATISSVRGPAMYIVMQSNEATNAPAYDISTRLWYVDN